MPDHSNSLFSDFSSSLSMDQPVREFLSACPLPATPESGSGPGPGSVPGHGPSPGPSGLQNPIVAATTAAAAVVAANNNTSNRILSRNANGTSKCYLLAWESSLACKQWDRMLPAALKKLLSNVAYSCMLCWSQIETLNRIC